MRLQSRVALVSGATYGIGATIVELGLQVRAAAHDGGPTNGPLGVRSNAIVVGFMPTGGEVITKMVPRHVRAELDRRRVTNTAVPNWP